MRKIASIRRVTNIEAIEGADRIEKVSVDGWFVVAQKGLHQIGNTVIYVELDGFLPETDSRFESFMKFGTRTFNGVVGHRIKTVRLKGVYSQGVILPVSEFPEVANSLEGDDVSELIGIVKWEAPEVVEGNINSQPKGNFPWFLRKSDQERIQNVYKELSTTHADKEFIGTLKMDGSSLTVFYVKSEITGDEDRYGICSRNLELKYDETVPFEEQSAFIKGTLNSDLINKVKELSEIYGGSWAIQSELVGPGIQSNYEKFDKYQAFSYNIFSIDRQQFVTYREFNAMAIKVDLQTVPVIAIHRVLNQPLADILASSDGSSIYNPIREGIVWKELDGTTQFKAISNKYLEKN